MGEEMEPTTLLPAVNTVTPLLKSLSDEAKTMNKAEMGGVIIGINNAMMDLHLKQQELPCEKGENEMNIQDLNRFLEQKVDIKYNVYQDKINPSSGQIKCEIFPQYRSRFT